MGEPDHPLPGGLQRRVAGAIALEGRAVASGTRSRRVRRQGARRGQRASTSIPSTRTLSRGRRDVRWRIAEGREAVLERRASPSGGPCRIDQAPAAVARPRGPARGRRAAQAPLAPAARADRPPPPRGSSGPLPRRRPDRAACGAREVTGIPSRVARSSGSRRPRCSAIPRRPGLPWRDVTSMLAARAVASAPIGPSRCGGSGPRRPRRRARPPSTIRVCVSLAVTPGVQTPRWTGSSRPVWSRESIAFLPEARLESAVAARHDTVLACSPAPRFVCSRSRPPAADPRGSVSLTLQWEVKLTRRPRFSPPPRALGGSSALLGSKRCPADTISFARGAPSADILPREAVREAAATALAEDWERALSYGTGIGHPGLAEWIAERHGDLDASQVMIANGSLEAGAMLFAHLLEPGDRVIVEQPTYDRTLLLLQRLGVELVPVPLEADGVDLAALRGGAGGRARSSSPTSFPTSTTPPAAPSPPRSGCAWSSSPPSTDSGSSRTTPTASCPFEGDPLETMLEIDRADRVIFASSFSKTVSPGVRVGYLAGPAGEVAKLAKRANETYISPNMLAESIVLELCRSGGLDRNIEFVKGALQARRDALVSALARADPRGRVRRPRRRLLPLARPRRGVRHPGAAGRGEGRGRLLRRRPRLHDRGRREQPPPLLRERSAGADPGGRRADRDRARADPRDRGRLASARSGPRRGRAARGSPPAAAAPGRRGPRPSRRRCARPRGGRRRRRSSTASSSELSTVPSRPGSRPAAFR